MKASARERAAPEQHEVLLLNSDAGDELRRAVDAFMPDPAAR